MLGRDFFGRSIPSQPLSMALPTGEDGVSRCLNDRRIYLYIDRWRKRSAVQGVSSRMGECLERKSERKMERGAQG